MDAVEYLVAHTADLEPGVLAEARAVLDLAFDGDFGDDDWEHGLGGLHALALGGGTVVGHASVVQRRLVTGGRALRAGYVEGVGVHPGWRRRGVAGALMTRLERVIQRAYDLGALGATDEAIPLYVRHGWRPWRGTLAALTPTGPAETPDEQGAVYVLEAGTSLDLDAELACDWRDGDVW
jgi:aminoglycoside 2'-N-acetyltransferase I